MEGDAVIIYWAYCEKHEIHYPDSQICDECFWEYQKRIHQEEQALMAAADLGGGQDDVPGELRPR